MTKLRRIEVDFPVEVELTEDELRGLDQILTQVCDRYRAAHPDRVMWVFGVGSKMLVHPMLVSDEEPIPFDNDILHFEIAERENY